ncbi:hypothetical protein MVEN_01869500 [Mycena venus]|uniref:Uncharacterized protein n=1 Tax=Mycena venus TaxID=2733690 RepID=A0A8H6XIV6_9AGAR|nr:hypothetical protein MVEN_01869500 [Mycena venus]
MLFELRAFEASFRMTRLLLLAIFSLRYLVVKTSKYAMDLLPSTPRTELQPNIPQSYIPLLLNVSRGHWHSASQYHHQHHEHALRLVSQLRRECKGGWSILSLLQSCDSTGIAVKITRIGYVAPFPLLLAAI